MLWTGRLYLHLWSDRHRDAFAAMHADPIVMADQGGPITRAASDTKLDRYISSQTEHGITRWAVEDRHGLFLGYAGVTPRLDPAHPLGLHHEIGWRFIRAAWGHGYATESARAALSHAADHLPGVEIIAYTAPENHRSQAVMARLGLLRDPDRDFERERPGAVPWPGLVWIAHPQS